MKYLHDIGARLVYLTFSQPKAVHGSDGVRSFTAVLCALTCHLAREIGVFVWKSEAVKRSRALGDEPAYNC